MANVSQKSLSDSYTAKSVEVGVFDEQRRSCEAVGGGRCRD